MNPTDRPQLTTQRAMKQLYLTRETPPKAKSIRRIPAHDRSVPLPKAKPKPNAPPTHGELLNKVGTSLCLESDQSR